MCVYLKNTELRQGHGTTFEKITSFLQEVIFLRYIIIAKNINLLKIDGEWGYRMDFFTSPYSLTSAELSLCKIP